MLSVGTSPKSFSIIPLLVLAGLLFLIDINLVTTSGLLSKFILMIYGCKSTNVLSFLNGDNRLLNSYSRLL